MKIKILIPIFFLLMGTCIAQVLPPSLSSNESTEFAFEVKTIDEFLERFNNDSNTLIRQYLEQKYPNRKIGRPELIRTLFNYEDPIWEKNQAIEFISEICDTTNEKFLDFYSDNWYAQAECRVKYKGLSKKVNITLQVSVSDRTGAAKWVICGARAPFLDFSKKLDPKKFLNPISHATDFIGLKKAMAEKQFLRNYLTDHFKENHLNKYLAALVAGDIIFEQINSVTYHFLALDNWVFTVKEFARPGRNSGWLIQTIARKSKLDKELYKKNILFCE